MIPSGIPQLDELIQGFGKGELIFLDSSDWIGRINLLILILLNTTSSKESQAFCLLFLKKTAVRSILLSIEHHIQAQNPQAKEALLNLRAMISYVQYDNEPAKTHSILILPFNEPSILHLLTRIKSELVNRDPATIAIEFIEYFPDAWHAFGRNLASKIEQLIFIANLRKIAQDYGITIILAAAPVRNRTVESLPDWLAPRENVPIISRDLAIVSDVVLHLDSGDQRQAILVNSSRSTLSVIKCPRGKLGKIDIEIV